MSDIFSAGEIVKIGIEIEKNGRDFYSALMRKAWDIKVCDIFKFLSQEEDKHIKVFQRILKEAKQGQEASMESDDYYAYMKSLADKYVFTRENAGIEFARAIHNVKDAVDKAINFERESIIFYDGIKKAVFDSGKPAVDSLIEQEKLHLQQLTMLKGQI